MAVIKSNNVDLSTAQTGNGDSTNTGSAASRLGMPGAIVITSTIGATPTVTVSLQGSADGAAWFNIPYALVATPSTYVVTNLTITTAVTTTYLLQANQPWVYVKLLLAANTNVTLTATAYL